VEVNLSFMLLDAAILRYMLVIEDHHHLRWGDVGDMLDVLVAMPILTALQIELPCAQTRGARDEPARHGLTTHNPVLPPRRHRIGYSIGLLFDVGYLLDASLRKSYLWREPSPSSSARFDIVHGLERSLT
jgi:hypothetical protein